MHDQKCHRAACDRALRRGYHLIWNDPSTGKPNAYCPKCGRNIMNFNKTDEIKLKDQIIEFQVMESPVCFYVVHLHSGSKAQLPDSDGSLKDEQGNELTPESPEFMQRWTMLLNENKVATKKIYFPTTLGSGY